MLLSNCFIVNQKNAACRVKLYIEKWFFKKVFKPFHNTFATKQWDARLFHYFGYKKGIEKFQIYQKKRAFTKVFSKVNFFKVCNKFIITNVQLYLKIKYLQNSNACHHSPKIIEASGANLNTHKGKWTSTCLNFSYV